jgi:hypothetical protein
MRYLLFFGFLFISTTSFAGNDSSSEEIFELKDVYEVNPQWIPKNLTLQGDQPNCFAHAASYLFHYFLNSQASGPKISLTIPEIIEQGCPHQKKSQPAFSLLHHLRKIQKKPLSYNIHVFDPHSPQLNSDKQPQNEALVDSVDMLFAFWPNNQPFPIVIDYCDSFNTDRQKCVEMHAVTVTGVRLHCSAEFGCISQWYIHNSWGPEYSYWVDALEMADKILQAKRDITYIAPCQSESASDSMEVCTPEILGYDPEHNSKPKFRASLPLHFAVMTQDDDLFFHTWDQIKDPAELRKRTTPNQTLAHLALQFNRPTIFDWVIKAAPDLLEINFPLFGSLLMYAVHSHSVWGVSKIVTLAPDLRFLSPPGENSTPVVEAEELGNPEIIAAIHAGEPKVGTPPKKARSWWVPKWFRRK